MIKEIVNVFIDNQSKLKDYWLVENPGSYKELVNDVFGLIRDHWTGRDSDKPNPEK